MDNPRRCDPENPNRIRTVGFGFGSEKGTHEHQFVHRSKTFYSDIYRDKKSPFMMPSTTKAINDDRHNF